METQNITAATEPPPVASVTAAAPMKATEGAMDSNTAKTANPNDTNTSDNTTNNINTSSINNGTPKKVSQTCVTCRARKVRCDGRRNICSNCERLGFPCSFDDTPGIGLFDGSNGATSGSGIGASGAAGGAVAGAGLLSDSVAAPTTSINITSSADLLQSIPRRRARQACQNCHARKARCTGGTPQCDRCRSLGIECVYRPGKRTRLSPVSGSIAGDNLTSSNAMNNYNSNNGNNTTGHMGHRDDRYERGLSESSDHADVTMTGIAHGPAQASIPMGSAASASGLAALAGVSVAAGGLEASASSLATRSVPSEVLEALAMRTFDQFFRHIHHIPTFAFLHRASLMQRYRAGLVDRPLLLALVGITSLMTDLGQGTRELGKQCIAEAEALVLSRLDRPSTLGLQALVFVIHYRVLSGRFSSAFMLHGVASRFASALRLNHENTRLCFLARESRRRLMWALYMIDSSMANGYADFSLWAYRSDDAMNIQLPCNERNFEFDLPERTESLRPPPRSPGGELPPLPDDIGFLALHVRIRSLRGRVLQFTKDVTSSSKMALSDIASIPARCAEIADELDSFAARLPVSFRWSEGNVRLRTYSPRLCVFLMTHVWWEQCHCELYRLGLVGLQEALPSLTIAQVNLQYPSFVQHCRDQVLEHASAMAEMFRLLLTLDNGVPVTDLDLPICLYQCVRLLFYVSRGDGGVPHDSFLELAGVCTQVLARTVMTPATVQIRANLEKLMAQGLSIEIAPSGRSTPDIVQMETEDDISGLLQPARAAHGGGGGGGGGRMPQTSPGSVLRINRRAAAAEGFNAGLSMGLNGNGSPANAANAVMFDTFDIPGGLDTNANNNNTNTGGVTGQGQTQSGAATTPVNANTGTTADSSPQPTAESALDAFDLDVDNFGATDLGGWFSGDWVTNNEFAT
ncbi:nitrate assimilation regulatory protein [Ophiostoma piceae UAMH 11346]|uniref:Nitrate assimilation regulatory protein n=1 Tax=Ophiostoma piceae (strain UAMH 11346) TaxID=1262450 RepID=S3BNP7_OPHP1|nr:nitrate assimilation regulatory protein [Ophiostoma piceae UAMH 11346]